MNEPNPESTLVQKPISKAELERRLKFSKASLKHGQYRTPEYSAWSAMKQRCQNPKHPCFQLYGGRRITVCERWKSFSAFLEDMGKRPSPKHCLERLDNNRGYCPDNCAWKTQADQMRNTRRTILVTINGKTSCLKDWCIALGQNYHLASSRIQRGWTAWEAVMAPVAIKYRNKSYAR